MTDRSPLIVGNWKMNANHLEAIQMVQKLSYRLDRGDTDRGGVGAMYRAECVLDE